MVAHEPLLVYRLDVVLREGAGRILGEPAYAAGLAAEVEALAVQF